MCGQEMAMGTCGEWCKRWVKSMKTAKKRDVNGLLCGEVKLARK